MHIDRTEKIFIVASIILVVVFALAIAVSSIAFGIQVPSPYELIDPNTVATPGASPWGAPVDERVRELAPGKYEAYVLSQIWTFQPNEIRIPAGSEITFYLTSKDVQHGFKLSDTNINMMIVPGQVSTLTATFENPGTYYFICHEYCGAGHHTMYGSLIVE
ncbi:MAG: cytochrome c oxidase subunit II [Candidatus Promineifilaceae bacterium]|nr:cytochrome c oxidase subunit II [Candidatus Promineifilaceae bacterium]